MSALLAAMRTAGSCNVVPLVKRTTGNCDLALTASMILPRPVWSVGSPEPATVMQSARPSVSSQSFNSAITSSVGTYSPRLSPLAAVCPS